MTWSLNEIEALSRKAARGAGYSWGLAEEAGRAVRWLEARDLPGAQALVDHLKRVDGQDLASFTPDADSWTAPGGTACPILAGTMLADGMARSGPDPITLPDLASPLLLLPFLSWMATAQGRTVGIGVSDTEVALSPEGTLTQTANIPSPASAPVALRFGVDPAGDTVAEGLRSACSADTVAALNAFAHRTYAPATEESRLAGAGAGLTDND
ncbi:DUF3726 domain-containing protein [Nioella sediminis]|jgi:hypothetical protein|uniref:DUF3726 domain-containing protein n=1 Tax=Nioella sediminis TaxID=1912092 RepID=UPI0008FD2B6F|nr:DUF3726 domain-containing protein [Nioella sediminis]TBX21744.1 hypothetical protein TK43_12940 [Roseovarius sp. JS7-11]